MSAYCELCVGTIQGIERRLFWRGGKSFHWHSHWDFSIGILLYRTLNHLIMNGDSRWMVFRTPRYGGLNNAEEERSPCSRSRGSLHAEVCRLDCLFRVPGKAPYWILEGSCQSRKYWARIRAGLPMSQTEESSSGNLWLARDTCCHPYPGDWKRAMKKCKEG